MQLEMEHGKQKFKMFQVHSRTVYLSGSILINPKAGPKSSKIRNSNRLQTPGRFCRDFQLHSLSSVMALAQNLEEKCVQVHVERVIEIVKEIRRTSLEGGQFGGRCTVDPVCCFTLQALQEPILLV